MCKAGIACAGRESILETLRLHREELSRDFGVRSLSLFGSYARGDHRPDSDVDLVVEFDRPTGLFGLIRLRQRLQELLRRQVDLGTLGSLRPRIRHRAVSEAVRVA